MAITSSTRPGRYLWPIAPALSVIFGTLLSLLPYGFGGGWLVTPAFALVPLYFWALHRPNLLPVAIVFLLGLVQDLMSGGPLGLWGLVFVTSYSVTLSQREAFAGMRLRLAWPTFGGIVLLGEFAGWFANSVYHADFIGARPMLLQTVSTTLVLPLFVPVLIFMEQEMASALRQH